MRARIDSLEQEEAAEKRHDLQALLEYYERSLARMDITNKDRAIVLHKKGVCHIDLGDNPAAVECLGSAQKLIKALNDDTPEMLDLQGMNAYYLACYRNDPGLFREACAALETLVAEHGDYPLIGQALPYLAAAYEFLGRSAEALAILKATLEGTESKSDKARIHHQLGTVYARMSAFEEAIHHFHKALKSCENEPEYHSKLYSDMGEALEQRGSIEQALAAYGKALRLVKHCPWLRDNSAYVSDLEGRVARLLTEDRVNGSIC